MTEICHTTTPHNYSYTIFVKNLCKVFLTKFKFVKFEGLSYFLVDIDSKTNVILVLSESINHPNIFFPISQSIPEPQVLFFKIPSFPWKELYYTKMYHITLIILFLFRHSLPDLYSIQISHRCIIQSDDK